MFKPALPFGALVLAASSWLPGWLDVGLATTTGLICMSQQFHAWAHMKKSQLPSRVVALQVGVCTHAALRWMQFDWAALHMHKP